MKKTKLRIGQVVVCKETGLEVTVSDLSFAGNKVGVISGCVAKIVDADLLEEKAHEVADSKPVGTAKVEEQCKCECKKSTVPTIEMKYDDEVNALYLRINEKTTICIGNVSPHIVNCIGVSDKNDTDEYNEEIGNALAFMRAFAKENAENKMEKENDFLKFMKMMNDTCEEVKAVGEEEAK